MTHDQDEAMSVGDEIMVSETGESKIAGLRGNLQETHRDLCSEDDRGSELL